jgi:hypothetical protein
MQESENMSHDEASRLIKDAAKDQQIDIVLSEEQMATLLRQWSADPERPALIKFSVSGRPNIELSAASYSYSGDTCCALREFVADNPTE